MKKIIKVTRLVLYLLNKILINKANKYITIEMIYKVSIINYHSSKKEHT